VPGDESIPKARLYARYEPLGGPVAVFGPNNFPLAYNGVAGTDSPPRSPRKPCHRQGPPSHPTVTRILAETAFSCLEASRLPRAAVQLLYRMQHEDGLALVADRRLGASAFTGNRPGGLRLKEAADKAGRPIYLEMSSVNPVFLLPGALRERGERIAAEMFGSCTAGAGQFCTKPGLIVLVGDEAGRRFFDLIKAAFAGAPAQVVLDESVLAGIHAALAAMTSAGADVAAGGHTPSMPGFRFENTLLRASGDAFLRSHERFNRKRSARRPRRPRPGRRADGRHRSGARGKPHGVHLQPFRLGRRELYDALAPFSGFNAAASSTTKCRPASSFLRRWSTAAPIRRRATRDSRPWASPRR